MEKIETLEAALKRIAELESENENFVKNWNIIKTER